jgi:Fic family protein
MDLEAFQASPCGHLEPIMGNDLRRGPWNYYAFVPDPLPYEPPLNLASVTVAMNAAMAVARLDQAASQLPNPSLLVRPAIRREAVSTSALEGTYTAYDELLAADFLEENQISSQTLEVLNYVRATEQALDLLDNYPMSRHLLGRLQKTIVSRTRDDSWDAGDLRQTQVCIGSAEDSIEHARFVPPPPGDILSNGFADWEKWVNNATDVPIIIRIALAHYQFEALHPFNNGNGRLGRLIAILQLVQENILRWPIVNLAPYLYDHREQYVEHLYKLSITGKFDAWVIFFSQAVRDQADSGIRAIQELISFRDRVLTELRSAGARGSILELVEVLIGYPLIDVPTVSEMLGRPFQTANQVVAKLVEHGVLREVTGRKMNRLFSCDEVRRITGGSTRRRNGK